LLDDKDVEDVDTALLVDGIGLQTVHVVYIEQGQIVLAHLVLIIVSVLVWIVIVLDVT